MQQMRLFVSPDGQSATWLHALDLTTGMFPQYDGWIDATDLDDAEFEALIRQLQGK